MKWVLLTDLSQQILTDDELGDAPAILPSLLQENLFGKSFFQAF